MKKVCFNYFGLIFLAATLFLGCKSVQRAIEVVDKASLTQEIYADKTEGSSGVTIKTTGDWTSYITEKSNTASARQQAPGNIPDWISINPSSGGAGTYTIVITLVVNTTGENRTAVITIVCGDTEITITVTQKSTTQSGETLDPLYYDEGVVLNGLRWATRNVDAVGTFAQNPESSGMFYQWNKKKAWPSTGNVSGWTNNPSLVDTWAESNDPSPAGWRVPTITEIRTLIDTVYVKQEWTSVGGKLGCRFTDKGTGKNIFIPAAGYRDMFAGGNLYGLGGEYDPIRGCYWSSTGHESFNDAVYFLEITDYSAIWNYLNAKDSGYTIRSVKK